MRPDAVLTEPPPSPRPNTQGGRPRKRGRLLRKPQQLAQDRRTPWSTTEAFLYGRKNDRPIQDHVCAVVPCNRNAPSSDRHRRHRLEHLALRVFFSFDATLDVRTILETYAGRWGIEVFFREAKQLLGFADSQARKEAAVLRVAPLVGLLYSTLVIWFVQDIYRMPIAALPVRPWYRRKVGLCFADILRTAQRTVALWSFLIRAVISTTYNNLCPPHVRAIHADLTLLHKGEKRVRAARPTGHLSSWACA